MDMDGIHVFVVIKETRWVSKFSFRFSNNECFIANGILIIESARHFRWMFMTNTPRASFY